MLVNACKKLYDNKVGYRMESMRMLNKDKCKYCFKFCSNSNSLGYDGKLYLSKFDCCKIDKIIKDNKQGRAFDMFAFDKNNNLLDYYDSKDIIFVNV